MKSKHIFILIAQTVIIIVSLLYAFIKQTESVVYRNEAVQEAERANAEAKLADQNAAKAVDLARELDECKKSK